MNLGIVRLGQRPRSNRCAVLVELALLPSECAPDRGQHLVNGASCCVHSRLREKGEAELANGLRTSLAKLIVSAFHHAHRAMCGWLWVRKAIPRVKYVLDVFPRSCSELRRDTSFAGDQFQFLERPGISFDWRFAAVPVFEHLRAQSLTKRLDRRSKKHDCAHPLVVRADRVRLCVRNKDTCSVTKIGNGLVVQGVPDLVSLNFICLKWVHQVFSILEAFRWAVAESMEILP